MNSINIAGASFALFALTSASVIADGHSRPHQQDQPPQMGGQDNNDPDEYVGWMQRFAEIKHVSPDFQNHEVKRAIEKEPWYGIYECEKFDWKGKCQWRQTVPEGERTGGCFNRLFDSPNGSVGIDKGIYCSGFLDRDCKGSYRTVDYTYSLLKGAPEFQNPQSFRCWKPRFGDPHFEVDYEETVAMLPPK